MKKIFTLLTAALVTLTSFADHNDGKITITDLSRKQLWIEVDGHRYQDHGREMVIDDLHPGYHRVEVYTRERYSDWKNIFDRNGRKQVLFYSSVLVRPRRNICITINRFGEVQVDERRMNGDYGKDRGKDWDRGKDRDYDHDRDDSRSRDYDRDNRYDNTRGAMDTRSFEMLKSALNRESFEKSRMEMACQTIDRNNFSTMQVRDLALLFAFENNKLQLAKYAYGNTVDKGNYFQLNDVFSFSNSKEELADYIRKYR